MRYMITSKNLTKSSLNFFDLEPLLTHSPSSTLLIKLETLISLLKSSIPSIITYYLIFFFLGILAPDFLAVSKAIATACFCGFPCSISVFMFLLMVFLLFPFDNGIYPLCFHMCLKLQPNNPVHAKDNVQHYESH